MKEAEVITVVLLTDMVITLLEIIGIIVLLIAAVILGAVLIVLIFVIIGAVIGTVADSLTKEDVRE